jgi:hypothetical protein
MTYPELKPFEGITVLIDYQKDGGMDQRAGKITQVTEQNVSFYPFEHRSYQIAIERITRVKKINVE